MPTRLIKTMPNFNGVAANQTATADLPVGKLKYHQLRIRHTAGAGVDAVQATMEANIAAVRLKVNGKVQRTFTSRQLIDINTYRGIGFDPGYLPMIFSQPWARTSQVEDALGWGTGDVDSFQVEVDIAAGAVTPTLSASALVSLSSEPMGPIVKWRAFNVPVTAVGVVNVLLPKNDAYMAIHADSANVTDVEVIVDGERYFDRIRKADLTEYYSQTGLTQQADWFNIDFAPTGRGEHALPMFAAQNKAVRDFRVDFTLGAAVTFPLITETLGLRD
jgi:Viral coat protein P2 N-terminal domain